MLLFVYCYGLLLRIVLKLLEIYVETLLTSQQFYATDQTSLTSFYFLNLFQSVEFYNSYNRFLITKTIKFREKLIYLQKVFLAIERLIFVI